MNKIEVFGLVFVMWLITFTTVAVVYHNIPDKVIIEKQPVYYYDVLEKTIVNNITNVQKEVIELTPEMECIEVQMEDKIMFKCDRK